jgi:hypothetical protein
MRRQRNRIGRSASRGAGRARRWRGLAALIGVLCVISICAAAACFYLFSSAVASRQASPEALTESDFLGTWCSSRGDRLDLADGRFSIDRMSPTLASQIGYFIPTPDPSRSHHWDDPPATSAAGTWYVDVLGPDLLSDQVVSVIVHTEQLDGETVVGDALEFSIDRTDTGWQLFLDLKPAGSGEIRFAMCADAK